MSEKFHVVICICYKETGLIFKTQVSRYKKQEASFKLQGSSNKRQVLGFKIQEARFKLQDS